MGGILWRGGSFLAAQRPEGHPQAGFWEFPGGKVEPGESLDLTEIGKDENGVIINERGNEKGAVVYGCTLEGKLA